MLDSVGADGFIARRVQEWSLFKALQSGAPVDREALTAATNWLQRKVVEEADSTAVLAVLGEVGRTKRVRKSGEDPRRAPAITGPLTQAYGRGAAPVRHD